MRTRRSKGPRPVNHLDRSRPAGVGRTRLLALTLGLLAAGCSSTATTHGGAASSSVPAPKPPNAPSLLGDAGGWIAYQTADGGTDRVHLVRPDGTDDHAIASSLPGRTAHPDFSPDGRHLVIDQLTSEDDVDQLYVADGAGRSPRLLVRCRPSKCLDHWEAAWSPDGRRLAISTAGGRLTGSGPSRFGLAVVDVRTGRITAVIDHPSRQGQDHFARWSPDGSQLVFWRERSAADRAGRTAIFRVDVSGHHLRQLTPWPMDAGDPDWSRDGSIVFSTHPLLVFDGRADSELFRMRPDGTGRRPVTRSSENGFRATQPRWTPDGRAILYVRAGASGLPRQIYVVSRDGTRDLPLLTQRSVYTHPDLQPRG